MRALVVEDMRQMRELLSKMLHKMSQFEFVDNSENGEAAWEKLIENAKTDIHYDIVLCDVNMDKLDGIEFLKRCRSHEDFRFLPFLMISGASEQANISSALGEWGANDFIVKPVSYDLLCSRITTILKRAQSPEEVLFRHMEQLKREGATDEALALIDRAEMMNRISLAKWVNAKGECLMQAGEVDKAAAEFEKAIEISGIFVAAYKNSSTAHQRLGHMDKAIEVLERVEKICPKDNERTFQLGELLLKQGNSEAGTQYLQNVLKRANKNDKEQLLKKVAQTYIEAGLFHEAEKVCIAAMEYNDSDPEIYNRLGMTLRQQGKFDEALQCYLNALKKNPGHAGLYHNIGILHVAKRDLGAARKHFEKALSLDPRMTDTKAMLKKLEEMADRK